ncbi:glycoside hydrolase [Sphingomonas populi]|uniref:Glycoside hydrolase n=1 Tax=Sphingomonas populi TaxID=2484750 RepID=A0A4Q6XR01_9SPHN|nr:glycosyl hydrolase [Sphingomonas populi]RZF59109.1 glycoside hydrolase [Sphingomonas populi]
MESLTARYSRICGETDFVISVRGSQCSCPANLIAIKHLRLTQQLSIVVLIFTALIKNTCENFCCDEESPMTVLIRLLDFSSQTQTRNIFFYQATFRFTRYLTTAALIFSVPVIGEAQAQEHVATVRHEQKSAVTPLSLGAFGKDPTLDRFRNPPASSRPYVWWHWMNGNVTAEGARLDLEWMKAAGIGGVQLFEGNLVTPQLVDKRLIWMSPEWRQALQQSATTAKQLGLDFAIATSPGWSSTGAPFVEPAAAMKKLVWTETQVVGGKRLTSRLPLPSSVAGPFQDIDGGTEIAPFYRDALVLAIPELTDNQPVAAVLTSSAGGVDLSLLNDGKFGPAMSLPFDPAHPEAWILSDYGTPVTMRSATLGLPGSRGFGAPPPPDAIVEASDDGKTFRTVATMPSGTSQARSVAFAPVKARFFRLGLTTSPIQPAGGPPGVVPLSLGPPPSPTFSVSEWVLRPSGRINHAEDKAGFAAAPNYYAIATDPESGSRAPKAGQVIDITRYMSADGILDWSPPQGRWTVLRLGYSLTGHQNGPAPKEAAGLEVDKLDASAVRRYATTYLDRYSAAVGDGQLLNGLVSDSIEAGAQNWTQDIISDFKRLRGYDPTPWLPTLTGRIIDSAEKSDAFLWDYRQTISDLLAKNHYGTLASIAKERGLTYYAEALEDHRPQLGDDLAMRAPADVPMGAMWMIPAGEKPRATYVADLQGAASVAHVYGKPLVAAESFTAFGAPWGFAPRDLKATADNEFALGVNRIMVHTSPHQPFVDCKPGMSLAPLLGQYFSRNETWAPMARGWTDYLARSSYLLQAGRPAAEIAYFPGEEAPITGLYGDVPVAVPAGFGFDFVGADALRNSVSVASDGSIITTGGARYAMIVLGGSSARMTLGTLQRLRNLARAGAVIVGPAPIASPSLADDPAAFRAIVNDLWGARRGPLSGRVFIDVQTALKAIGLERDWQISAAEDRGVAVLKRQLHEGALWFFANRSGHRLKTDVSLRLTGFEPEIWSADTGEVRAASYHIENGRTFIPLDLAQDEAVFIVLRQRSIKTSRTIATLRTEILTPLDGMWRQSFPTQGEMAAWDRPAPLGSWADAGKPTRFFSGTAHYTRNLVIKRNWRLKGRRFVLDLGDVREVAEVRVNGRTMGIAWKPPFTVDVTNALRTGQNRVEVAVANLWVNRLIGDAQPGASKVTTTNGPSYTANATIRPSGLLGPVVLKALDAP